MNPRKIVKKVVPKKLFKQIAPYGHLAEGVAYSLKAGFPARGMKVIGVTGTNGKTTTAFMIHRMLQEAGYKTALMTTVAWGIGNDIHEQKQHYTNVPVPQLMRRLKAVRAAKVDYLVLEMTSQGLHQHRAFGVPFSVAVFTNLTHEHITYHGSFENYRTAKVKLFKLANKNKQGLRVGVVNADDPSAKYFAEAVAHPVRYGVDKGDVRAKNVKLAPSGVSYETNIEGKTYHIKTQIPGSFNIYNSLAAVCVGHALGLGEEQIERGIAALEGVEGRMTRIDEGQDFDLIVDYAHTPDSFEKLFSGLRPSVKGRMIAVFGSQGGGDKGKRPMQGELAGKYCDEVIITEEDDRLENPQQIMEDIAVAVEKAGKRRDKNLFLVHNRTEAIQFAVNRAKKGDVVLLLGKGHEKTIEDANGEHDWNEIVAAHQALKKRQK